MKKITLIFGLVMVVAMFTFFAQQVQAMGTGDVPNITPTELSSRLQSKDKVPFILDVREPQEFEMGHIEGAKLIPLGSLPEHLADVPKDKPVVVVCRSGNRSGRAAAFLKEQGFTNIENLTGGMTAWSAQCGSKKYC
jgi:rhodanese-related sulfurtransferase